MAVAGQGLDFAWFRYSDAATPANHWAMRVDTAWGSNAASGFAAFNAADPVWPRTRKYRARAVILTDSASGRRTELKVGAQGATVYAKGQQVTRYVRGLEDAITFTVTALVGEKQPNSNPKINSFPEYSAAL